MNPLALSDVYRFLRLLNMYILNALEDLQAAFDI